MRLSSLFCFLLFIFFACTKQEPIPPNIVLIMADDLGYGDLSSYGNETIQTPNIDRLANEGMKFTSFYSNGSVCSPTRAALMSGKYQQRVGIPGVVFTWLRDSLGMSQNVVTLAEVLKESGYSTGIFGKWHLGYKEEFSPVHQGFDTFKGFISGNVDYHSHLDNMNIFDWWHDLDTVEVKGYTTDIITENALDFISKNKENPFLLYLPHESPHGPFQGRKSPPERQVGKDPQPIDEAEIPVVYKEMIEVLDEGVGQVMDRIEELGLEENTVFIFCSDNGPTRFGSAGDLRGLKASLYEGGIRVPAMIKWKGKIMPGEIHAPAMSMDIFPTLLDLIGTETPEDLDGVSLAGHLFGQENLIERDLFWEYNGRQAILRGDWKLHRRDSVIELYDLKNDLSESKNLAIDKPEVTLSLINALESWKMDVSVN